MEALAFVRVMVNIILIVAVMATHLFKSESSDLEQNAVTTISGNGYAGDVNGTPTSTSFMFPAGIAFDTSTRSTYVADSAGQRIRKIDRFGVSSTVAGSGEPLPSGLGVAGGYLDGPVAKAKFDHPTGIAIGKNGHIYVADTFNHCIREIAGGNVSTLVGMHLEPGARDGTLSEATFREPRGIAIDDEGAIYVADFGNGIRKVDMNSVTSVPSGTPQPISVSLNQSNGHTTLFYASQGNAFRYNLSDRTDVISIPSSLEGPLGLDSIVAIDANEIVLSSPLWNVLYVAAFDCPAGMDRCLRILAGGSDEDHTQSGSFADGTLDNARFYTPLGMAKGASSDILVADGGNRRIRDVLLSPSPRPAAPPRETKSVLLITGPSAYDFVAQGRSLPDLLRSIPGYQSLGFHQVVLSEQSVPEKPDALISQIREIISNSKPDFTLVCLNRNELASSKSRVGNESDNIISRIEFLRSTIGSNGRLVFFPLGQELADAINPTDASVGLSSSTISDTLQIDFDLQAKLRNHFPQAVSLVDDFIQRRLKGHDELFEDDGSRLSFAGRRLLATLIYNRVGSRLSNFKQSVRLP